MATRIIFMGTPDFSVSSLAALVGEGYDVVGVVTQPDRPSGRGRELTASPVKRFAGQKGLAVLQPATLRRPDPVAALARLEPDMLVVAAYGLILPQSVLDIPTHGSLNVHASLLPEFRGAAPVAAAILAGKDRTGVTIMLMDAGMDTGPLLSQRECSVDPQETTGTLTARLSDLGAGLLTDTLPKWLAGKVQPRPQLDEQATYAPMIRKADGRIDWTLPADLLARRVRAFQPWPGAMTYWDGKPLKLLKVQALAVPAGGARPGTVVA